MPRWVLYATVVSLAVLILYLLSPGVARDAAFPGPPPPPAPYADVH
jgi:hypothetical protein